MGVPQLLEAHISLDQKAHFSLGANMAPEGRMFYNCTVWITYTQSPRILIVFLTFIYSLVNKEGKMILCFDLSKMAFQQNQERMTRRKNISAHLIVGSDRLF